MQLCMELCFGGERNLITASYLNSHLHSNNTKQPSQPSHNHNPPCLPQSSPAGLTSSLPFSSLSPCKPSPPPHPEYSVLNPQNRRLAVPPPQPPQLHHRPNPQHAGAGRGLHPPVLHSARLPALQPLRAPLPARRGHAVLHARARRPAQLPARAGGRGRRHVYVTGLAMGWDAFVDVAGWNVLTWGNVGVTAFLFGNRVLYFLGVFGYPSLPVEDDRKRV